MRKPWLISGVVVLILLLALAAWLLTQPPRITGPRAPKNWLTTTNPALEVKFKYDPAVFKLADYDDRAEFPLRLDAADWGFYAKRIAGAGTFLRMEPQPVVYEFVTDIYSDVYEEFYKLTTDGDVDTDTVEIQGQLAVRQHFKLLNTPQALGWPAFFPHAVTQGHPADLMGDDSEVNEILGIPGITDDPAGTKPRGANEAWVYAWGLFQGQDLFLFQAVSSRELTPDEVALAEQMINNTQFDALRGAAAPKSAPAAEPQAPPAPPSATTK
jgi:hypothetical protein